MKWLQKFLYKTVHEIIQIISASGPLHLLYSSKMLFPWACIPCSFISLRSLLKQHLLWETFPCHSKNSSPLPHVPTPIFNVLLFLLTFIISWQVSILVYTRYTKIYKYLCIYRHLSNYSLSKDCFCFSLKRVPGTKQNHLLNDEMYGSNKAQRRQLTCPQLHKTSEFRYQTSLQLPATMQALKATQSNDGRSLIEKWTRHSWKRE